MTSLEVIYTFTESNSLMVEYYFLLLCYARNKIVKQDDITQ